jgi:septal ring factor EnvC (AmiA/AmiB activator)
MRAKLTMYHLTARPAQRKLKRRQKTSARQGGFHGVNAIVADQLDQANDALVNLVSAAAADRDQMAILNRTINTQNETIAALTKQYQTLGSKMDALNSHTNPPPPPLFHHPNESRC